MRAGLQITPRDVELLCALLTHRCLTAEQFVALGFFGSCVRANSRLRKLRLAGFIRQVDGLPFSLTSKYYELASPSIPLVGDALEIDSKELRISTMRGLSLLQFTHAQRVTEFEIALRNDLPTIGTPEFEWHGEVLCHHTFRVERAGTTVRYSVKPDGFVRIGEQAFFVEIDLGHVSRDRFAHKLLSYQQYYGGIYQATYGDETFGVLIVTTGVERRSNLQSLASADEPTCLFTTFREIEEHGVFAPVWSGGPNFQVQCLPVRVTP